jgi:FemAB-related protein (PEP-CTERM system-associated)
MIVKQLTAPDARWDSFVEASPDGTFCHLSGWKRAIETAMGHTCPYLYVEDAAGDIQGVLPLTHIRSRLFGEGLVSNGFCVYGGPLARSAEAMALLDAAASDLLSSSGADYLEYRSRRPLHPDWQCKDALYVTFRKEMSADHDANMKAIPRKQRAMVRKGINAGLVGEEDDTPDRFFSMYAESVRNLGTPVFPKAWFHALQREFGDKCQVLSILHEGQPVAAVMSFFFRNEVLPYYGGGGLAARPVAGNDFMYWEVMRRAADRGMTLFDFGRSKVGTGPFNFKKYWGFEPEPLYYEYNVKAGRAMPDINPLNPKYALMINTWRRLPLSVANRLGPFIARNLG